MKNSKILFVVTLLSLISTATHAAESRRELLCDLEEKLSIKESRTYRDSLRWGSTIDNYANIKERVDALQVQSRAVVKANCLQGKPSSAISAQLTTLWTQGCAPIVNPTLNPVCMRFQALNDGTNVAKLSTEIPSLAELINAQDSSDCSPGVSDSSIIKDLNRTPSQILENAAGRR